MNRCDVLVFRNIYLYLLRTQLSKTLICLAYEYNKTLGKSLEISLKNDSNKSKENWVNLNKRYLCEHERYKYSCRLCKGMLSANMANKNITVKYVWVVLYANIIDGDTFAKNAMEKGFVNMVNRDRFVILVVE